MWADTQLNLKAALEPKIIKPGHIRLGSAERPVVLKYDPEIFDTYGRKYMLLKRFKNCILLGGQALMRIRFQVIRQTVLFAGGYNLLRYNQEFNFKTYGCALRIELSFWFLVLRSKMGYMLSSGVNCKESGFWIEVIPKLFSIVAVCANFSVSLFIESGKYARASFLVSHHSI